MRRARRDEVLAADDPVAAVDVRGVLARAAVEEVGRAVVGDQLVVAGATAQAVGPDAAVQAVVAAAARQRIDAAATFEVVVAVLAPQSVVAGAPEQDVVAETTPDEVVAGATPASSSSARSAARCGTRSS